MQEFENKRQKVIEILQLLTWIWPSAAWYLLIVQSSYVSNEILDILISSLQEAITSVQDKAKKEVFQQALSSLQTLKEKEALSRQQDEFDIDLLMKELE